jgi:hypothetical protein
MRNVHLSMRDLVAGRHKAEEYIHPIHVLNRKHLPMFKTDHCGFGFDLPDCDHAETASESVCDWHFVQWMLFYRSQL